MLAPIDGGRVPVRRVVRIAVRQKASAPEHVALDADLGDDGTLEPPLPLFAIGVGTGSMNGDLVEPRFEGCALFEAVRAAQNRDPGFLRHVLRGRGTAYERAKKAEKGGLMLAHEPFECGFLAFENGSKKSSNHRRSRRRVRARLRLPIAIPRPPCSRVSREPDGSNLVLAGEETEVAKCDGVGGR